MSHFLVSPCASSNSGTPVQRNCKSNMKHRASKYCGLSRSFLDGEKIGTPWFCCNASFRFLRNCGMEVGVEMVVGIDIEGWKRVVARQHNRHH